MLLVLLMNLISRLINRSGLRISHSKDFSSELKTLEWWISGLMLNPLFFLISRLNIAEVLLSFLISRLIIRSGLRISHSKVFSSGHILNKQYTDKIRFKNSWNSWDSPQCYSCDTGVAIYNDAMSAEVQFKINLEKVALCLRVPRERFFNPSPPLSILYMDIIDQLAAAPAP